MRLFWFCISVFCFSLLLISHFVLEKYLFMPPCEQCVYIRFSIAMIAVGSFVATFKIFFSSFFGYILGFGGIIYGFISALKLNSIYKAIKELNSFGITPCKMEPDFLFGLKLHQFDFFRPKGDCGFDMPVVPLNVNLSPLQSFFIDLYKDGWYLIPNLKFINLAEACIVIFVILLAALIFRIWRMI